MQNQKSPVNIEDLKGMPPESIISGLLQRDILLTDIAEALEVSPSHISNVIRRKSVSYSVAKAISLALNLPVVDVFGTKEEPTRGRKPRKKRREQVIEAIRAGISVPSSV